MPPRGRTDDRNIAIQLVRDGSPLTAAAKASSWRPLRSDRPVHDAFALASAENVRLFVRPLRRDDVDGVGDDRVDAERA